MRSIMERMPAIGQAIAKSMNVSVSAIKKLGSEGKLTTDIIIKAMGELATVKAPPPDPYKIFQKTLEDLNTTIGTKLLPNFTPLVQKVSELVDQIIKLNAAQTVVQALTPLFNVLLKLLDVFSKLPTGVQSFIIQIGAIAGVFALIAVPLGMFLQALGSIITVVGNVILALKGMTILSSIAGWLGAVIPIVVKVVSALLNLGRIVAAVFSGPIGWVALAVAAGIAIYAFRDKIAAAFRAIGTVIVNSAKWFYDKFVVPIGNFAKQAYDSIINAFRHLGQVLAAPFQAVANTVRGIINQMVGGIGNAMNAVVSAINKMISGANRALARLRLPQIPLLPSVPIPRFAEGGYVDKPTLALIGEGGEGEFVVPRSKATDFAQSWMNNKNSGGTSAATSTPTINIQTGPVMQQDGTRYVTLGDMEQALSVLASNLLGNNRSTGGRRFQGV